MSNQMTTRRPAPPTVFRRTVEKVAHQFLAEKAATPEGKAVAARFAMGFAAAAAAARNPAQFYNASPLSIAGAAAKSLDTGLVPGGVMPEVWLIPRGSDIQWMPSHRGLIRLARKAGFLVRAVVVHADDLDSVQLVDGEVTIAAQDPSLYVSRLQDVGGVAVFATDRATGERICAHWVPGDKVRAAKNAGQGGSVWSKWPAEMASKAAIKDAFARGYIPLESDALQVAMSAEPEYQTDTVAALPDVRVSALPDPDDMPDAEPADEPKVVDAPVVEAPEQPGDAEPAEDPADIKGECAALEDQLGSANVEQVRLAGFGPPPGKAVQSWKAGAEKASAYRDELRKALAPPEGADGDGMGW